MAGNEQRPTDDVEGHGVKRPEDETAGDDRGTRYPDDTEGHIYRRPSQDPEAVDEDQAGDAVEGHRRYQSAASGSGESSVGSSLVDLGGCWRSLGRAALPPERRPG